MRAGALIDRSLLPPKLRPPVGRVPFWLPGQPTTLVQVPEASVHEDRDTAALDRDVRLARQALDVRPEPPSEAVQRRARCELGPGVPAADAPHDRRLGQRRPVL